MKNSNSLECAFKVHKCVTNVQKQLFKLAKLIDKVWIKKMNFNNYTFNMLTDWVFH